MQMLFKNEVIDYSFFNNQKGDTILFLHGWGGDKFSFSKTINLLKSKYNILTITMPTTTPTISVWDMFDYVELIKQILTIHSVKSTHIICHSFGFRVALILKENIQIKSIVVTGGAGVKINKKFNFLDKINKNSTKISLKTCKIKNFFEKVASKDYLALSQINRQTFKNIVNFDLKFLTKFSCPMLLFWGGHDTATPVAIAKKISRENNSKLLIVKSDHFAYLKENSLFNHAVMDFLKINEC